MKSRWLLVLAALALAAFGFWLWRIEPRGGANARELDPEAPRTGPPIELAEEEVPEVAPAPAATPPDAQRTSVEPPAPAAAPDPKLAEIRGRFVFPDGAPVAGMAYEVHGWESNQEDVRKYGLPEHWEDPSGETDADGRVSVRFEPPRAYQFTFEAKTPGYAGAEWRWGEILAGSVVDLGEVELVAGGTIEGRILDEQGNPLLGQEWLVYARSVGLGEFDGRDETQVIADVDPSTASYRAEDVMPGRVELEAYTWPARWVEHGVVQVRSGETLTVDIVDAAPKTSRSITLEASSRLLHTICPEPANVTLTGPEGLTRTPKSSRFSFGHFVFEELQPGEYTLAIDDPRFRPWSRTVRPGAKVEAELEGTSALALRVRDGAGANVDFFSASVELRNVNFSPREIVVYEDVLHFSKGVVEGLTAGDYRITVRAGEDLGAVEVDALGLGETRAIDVLVGSQSVVSGRVRYSDGEPAAEVEVVLLPAVPRDPQKSERLKEMSLADRVLFDDDAEKGTTDEHGAFRFAIARPGEYRVCAWAPNGAEVVSEVLALGPSTDREGIDLVLARGGYVTGKILAPAGASCSGLRLRIGPDESRRIHRAVSNSDRELTPDGRFEIGPIAPGPSTVYLLLPAQKRRTGRGMSIGGGANNFVRLGTVEVREGERIERDFEVPEFPGTVALTVLVNGEALAGVGLELSMTGGEQHFQVLGETDLHGRFGPALAFPGSWAIEAHDPDVGWRYSHSTPVLVTAASESSAEIQVQVTEATLQFLDAGSGAPLANRNISLLGPPGDEFADFLVWVRRETDAEGRATWTLASGEYRFRLDPPPEEFPFFPGLEESQEKQRIAPVVWTLEGPLTGEVRL